MSYSRRARRAYKKEDSEVMKECVICFRTVIFQVHVIENGVYNREDCVICCGIISFSASEFLSVCDSK